MTGKIQRQFRQQCMCSSCEFEMKSDVHLRCKFQNRGYVSGLFVAGVVMLTAIVTKICSLQCANYTLKQIKPATLLSLEISIAKMEKSP